MSPALIALLVQYGLQYGIPAVTEIIDVLKRPDATIADVEALFAKIKSYQEYNIPNIVVQSTASAPIPPLVAAALPSATVTNQAPPAAAGK